MKKIFIQKIILGITLLTITFSVAGLSVPRKAEAQWIVEDPVQISQNVILIAQGAQDTALNYKLTIKAFILDTLATTLVKQLIRQITADVVNWINSGFEGSPAFVTNPGAFGLDIADQITGEFLAQAGGPLVALCSPFSIDIRLALVFKYHPNIQKKYACTLGSIIKNSETAVNNATLNGRSIGGFMNGDFSQGGWPAFVSLTTEPQNNIYGAYLTADSELSLRVANAKLEKRDEISAGKGFLSWRNPKCSADVKKNNDEVKENFEKLEDATGADYTKVSNEIGGDTTQKKLKSKLDCPIETPGSTIVNALEMNLNSPQIELALVDSINEIVNALAAQLVNTVLQGGLKAVSGAGPSDSTAYIQEIQNEANQSSLGGAKDYFTSSFEAYFSDTVEYKSYKDRAVTTVSDVKGVYISASKCYEEKIIDSKMKLTPLQVSVANGKMAQINVAVINNVEPLLSQVRASQEDASAKYKVLTDLRAETSRAQSAAELKVPADRFTAMIGTNSLVNRKDVTDAQSELERVESRVSPMRQDAQKELQQCQSFPLGFTTAN